MMPDVADGCLTELVDDLVAAQSAHVFRRFPGPSDRFAPLISWQAVDQLLERTMACPPRVRLMKNGRAVDESSYVRESGPRSRRLGVRAVTDQVRDGATLVVDAVDELHEPVGMLARDVERRLKAPTQVNLYAALKTDNGFNLHWDPHDVLVLQVSGRKRWEVYEETVKWPVDQLHLHELPDVSSRVWSGTLSAGEAAFIPRGWWHIARACGEPTLHLSFGITSPTALAFLQWLVDDLARDEWLRRDLPVSGSARDLESHIAACREHVVRALEEPALAGRFLTAWSARCRVRERAGLAPATDAASSVCPDTIIEVTAPFATVSRSPDGAVGLGVDGRILTLEAEAAPVIEYLLQHGRVSVGSLVAAMAATYGRSEIEDFANELARIGVVNLLTA